VLVRLSNTQALHAHGPEGSRFCALQNLATGAELTRSETQQNRLAGGSREQPSAGTASQGPIANVHKSITPHRAARLPFQQNGLGHRKKLRIDMALRARFDVANEEVARRGILFSNISEKSRLR
jgi:hypothetical protein